MVADKLRAPFSSVIPDGSSLDPLSLAHSVPPDRPALLFQYFEVGTRRLLRSVVGLEMTRLDCRNDIMKEMDRAHACPLLLFIGSEATSTVRSDDTDFPAALLLQLQSWVEFDHVGGQAFLRSSRSIDPVTELTKQSKTTIDHPSLVAGDLNDDWKHDADIDEYARRVAQTKAALAQKNVHGAVLSIGLSRETSADPFQIYRCISESNPSTYGYVVRAGPHALVGCSPVAFMRLADRRIQVETDAGTRPVSGDREADAAAEADLKANPKDAAEHRVVVDAELAAMAAIARDRKVEFPIRQQVRRFSHVMHLYTVLEAQLDEGVSRAQAILHMAPAAAVSGHPKRAACEIAMAVEGTGRGPYGGIIGLIDRAAGTAELAVVIRSLWLSGTSARFRVGGKIVPQSDADDEYRECQAKAKFLVDGVARAERGVRQAAS